MRKDMKDKLEKLLQKARDGQVVFVEDKEIIDSLQTKADEDSELLVSIEIDYPPTRSGNVMVHEFRVDFDAEYYRILIPIPVNTDQLRAEECGEIAFLDAVHLAECADCWKAQHDVALLLVRAIGEGLLYSANLAEARAVFNGARTLSAPSGDITLAGNKGVIKIRG